LPIWPQHLSEIESGKRNPRLSAIERMAEAELGK
jgi:transcriptional regulator with XRE-family HTH domain